MGLGYWSKDRPRLGTYDGMNQKGAYGLLDALDQLARRARPAPGSSLDARNLGLETRELRADWLRQGNFGVFVEYSRTPRDEPYTVRTGVQGIGTVAQRVPTPSATDARRRCISARCARASASASPRSWAAATTFASTSRARTRRATGCGAAAARRSSPPSRSTATFARSRRCCRTSTRHSRSRAATTAAGTPTATAWSTRHLTTGTNPFFLSLPLDNEAHQLFANGGYNLSERTRATFKVAYTRATQDEQIPVGTGVAVSPTAPSSLDGRLDTTLLQAGLTRARAARSRGSRACATTSPTKRRRSTASSVPRVRAASTRHRSPSRRSPASSRALTGGGPT